MRIQITGFLAVASAMIPACASRAPADSRLARVERAAAEYKHWTRVSDSARQAPSDCRMRPAVGAQMSASDAAASHGRKLYFLYAHDAWEYRLVGQSGAASDTAPNPVGQVLVKESFDAVECDAPQRLEATSHPGGSEYPEEYARVGERWFRCGVPRGLFIMMKGQPDEPDTDNGWTYATLTTDHNITECGRIASCIRCHEQAGPDRLFGLPYSSRDAITSARP